MDSDFPVAKTDWKNLSLFLPKSWADHIARQSRKLGVSRNAGLCLALKFGAPILDAHISMMGDTLRVVCEQVATGSHRIRELSEILAPTGKAPRASQSRRERKHRTGKR